MKYILMIVIGYVSFFISVFSFSQIIGSIQHINERRASATIATLLIHFSIVAFCIFAVITWLPEYKTPALVGSVIGFIMLPGKIE